MNEIACPSPTAQTSEVAAQDLQLNLGELTKKLAELSTLLAEKNQLLDKIKGYQLKMYRILF